MSQTKELTHEDVKNMVAKYMNEEHVALVERATTSQPLPTRARFASPVNPTSFIQSKSPESWPN